MQQVEQGVIATVADDDVKQVMQRVQGDGLNATAEVLQHRHPHNHSCCHMCSCSNDVPHSANRNIIELLVTGDLSQTGQG